MNEAALREVLRKLGRISAGPSATGTGHQATTALPETTTSDLRPGSADEDSAPWEFIPSEPVVGPPTEDEADVAEAYWERAAIMEFDGGLNRDEAARLARAGESPETQAHRNGTDLVGPAQIWIICDRPNTALPVEDTQFILDHGFEAYEEVKKRRQGGVKDDPDGSPG